MLRRIFMRQLTAAAIGGLFLGGCSNFALDPPGIPSGSQLVAYAAADFPPYGLGAGPRDTVIIGISYVDQRCQEFFSAVEQMSRRISVGRSVLVTSALQAQTLMGLAARSALRIAEVAAATEITKVLLDEYEKQYTFASHSSELKALIEQTMGEQRKEFAKVIDKIDSQVEAIAAVKMYAANCTLGTIREQYNRALAKAVREGVQPDNMTPVPPPGSSKGIWFESAPVPSPKNVLGVNKYVVQ